MAARDADMAKTFRDAWKKRSQSIIRSFKPGTFSRNAAIERLWWDATRKPVLEREVIRRWQDRIFEAMNKLAVSRSPFEVQMTRANGVYRRDVLGDGCCGDWELALKT